jgi:hypothetical protein
MLRVHVDDCSHGITIRVEGKITGEGVEELERCCDEALARGEPCALIIELDEVMYVDGRGEALLQRMHKAGVVLQGRGLHSRYLVERLLA